ncbi:MAG: nicotinic acid mononucleotide adenylyltransferase [Candidatus Thermofonsia Clade 1 bacterium]|uniref:Probable nicotinate-nucleotide adenylyltransferase n=1 Tax=Candidatus Thermofonsia Clade 1 bacterium TaxID=2364210 RepID=A0A2M8PCL8_9CHLR|nr:MAG: nicotinic acid mononucleotide adenylyltransferase [Candidatus Thermofonsia Clade 1 bacterium]RMF50356.1 MAG: nicotinate-nucleotide adenylyltransferase [Chloroflexota bacterium]
MPRLGVFGGTFDPPHVGHLILAQIARDRLNLERVLFVPAAQPPHKQAQGLTASLHRFAMLQRAIQGNAHFEISRVDMDRQGPHYTSDMLSILRAQNRGYELFFLMGADSLSELMTWRAPEWIIAQATLAVMRRPNVAINLEALEARLPGVRERVVLVDAPLIEISASSIRETVRRGHSIRYQVPDAVLEYIDQQRLYR